MKKIKNLPEKTVFRYNERSSVKWQLIKKAGKYIAQSLNSDQTRYIDRNKMVYVKN